MADGEVMFHLGGVEGVRTAGHVGVDHDPRVLAARFGPVAVDA